MASPTRPLTRKAFYDLAHQCRDRALELARHDQSRVYLKHCYDFNEWLAKVRGFTPLNERLRSLRGARPVARWQVMTLWSVLWLIVLLALPPSVGRGARAFFFYGFTFSLIVLYFVPEGLYGTTTELLEAKLLRVVDALEAMLQADEMEFTEAAFFQVKDALNEARNELRQQIDLAHRR